MANSITEYGMTLLRRRRDEIATRCDLWLEQIRTLLAEAIRTDTTPDSRHDLAVLEDRVLLSATPIVEAVELTVTQTVDKVNGDTASISNLIANDGGDGISLREAILAANQDSDLATILLAPGTYTLEINGEDNNAGKGDLDLNEDIDIRGAGTGATTIDASGIVGGDRVFHARNGATISIHELTISGGRGKEGAGVLVDEATSLALSDVVVAGNHSAGQDAGGISNQDGTLELTDVTIAGNSADNKEGGGIHNSGTATLNRVTVWGNRAKSGAGIYSEGSDSHLSLTNVTISNNHASNHGGGLYVKEQVEILHSTIAFNLAGMGGGIEEAGANVALKNSILAYNLQHDGTTESNVEGTIVSHGHNIDSDGTANLSGPGDQSNIDPLLSRHLSFNDGKTRTHALMPSSVGINLGGLTGAPTVDQRNVTRDANADVGAFEFIPAPNVAPTVLASQTFSVTEFSAKGTAIGTVQATDPDSDASSFEWTVIDGNERGIFAIDAASGELTVADSSQLDFTAASSHVLMVTVSDGAATATAESVTLEVRNAAPTDIALSSSVLTESTAGAVVGTLTSTDPTTTETHTYTVDDARFEIAGDELRLKADEAIEYSDESTVALQIESTDSAGNHFSEAFELTVTNTRPLAQEESLSLLFPDATQLDLGTLNAVQDQTTAEVGLGTEASASEEADVQAAAAESSAEEGDDSDFVAYVGTSAMQPAHSAVHDGETANGSNASMPVDFWGGEGLKERDSIEQRGLAFDNGSALPAVIRDIDREAKDATQEQPRLRDRLGQRLDLAQRAMVQPQLWQAIDSMNEEVNQSVASIPLKIGATATTTAGITAGYVVWVLRSGLLMSTAFANLPMWRFMDPLAILDSKGTDDEEDSESLQTIVAEENHADAQARHESVSKGASADV